MHPSVEYEPPPPTRLERLVLAEGPDFFPELSISQICEKYRAALRAAIAERLRELADQERVEVKCGVCGGVTDVSPSHFKKVSSGLMPAPMCFECKRPARAAKAEAEAVKWVEHLGDSAGELAGAVAALR